jgi:aminopeptidase N
VSCFQFAESPKISVYLYSLIAGPYVLHETTNPEIANFEVPLRIYSRKSLAKYVEQQKEDFFQATKSSIEFYGEIFSTPYPFSKLD